MATQTRIRLTERPLDVVLSPQSEAEASYRSAVLAPGFVPEPGLDLRHLGGMTFPHLTFTTVYLGRWDAGERGTLDRAIAAAMADPHLNNVLAQYFPGKKVTATFAGSQLLGGPAPARVYRDTVESIVRGLDVKGVACLLLPRGTVLVDGSSKGGDGVDSRHLLRGRGVLRGNERNRRVRRAMEERLRDALPRAAGDPHRSRRRGRDPRRRHACGRASARVVLAARRRDRRCPPYGHERSFRGASRSAARGRQRLGSDPAAVVERGRRARRADHPSTSAAVSIAL